jgi:O-antigen ligase
MAAIASRFITLTETHYLSQRDILASAAWHLFLDHPSVGVGLGGFQSAGAPSYYPHNLLLQVASEGGVVGLVLLLAGLGLLVYRWFQPRSVEHDFILAIWLLYFVASQVSGHIYDARLIWFYGMAYMLPKRQNIHAQDARTPTAVRIADSRSSGKAASTR